MLLSQAGAEPFGHRGPERRAELGFRLEAVEPRVPVARLRVHRDVHPPQLHALLREEELCAPTLQQTPSASANSVKVGMGDTPGTAFRNFTSTGEGPSKGLHRTPELPGPRELHGLGAPGPPEPWQQEPCSGHRRRPRTRSSTRRCDNYPRVVLRPCGWSEESHARVRQLDTREAPSLNPHETASSNRR